MLLAEKAEVWSPNRITTVNRAMTVRVGSTAVDRLLTMNVRLPDVRAPKQLDRSGPVTETRKASVTSRQSPTGDEPDALSTRRGHLRWNRPCRARCACLGVGYD